ncbi:MAG: SprT family zinc-dependent metalloprotease [Pseudohongiellaceae bacterium]
MQYLTEIKSIPLRIGSLYGRTVSNDVQCEIRRTRRKSLAIHIKHRKVEVRSPLRTSQREIRQFLASNEAWIQQKLLEESQRYRESLRIERGRRIFYRARELTIVFDEQPWQKIIVTPQEFIVQGPELTPERARNQVDAFLIEKAANYLPGRTRALARHLRVGHKLTEVKFRKTKSKWGHCTPEGVIQFNWLIMLAPYAVVDYMIAHEVCHLVHLDHSSRFWNLVEEVCPNHDYYMNWLKEHEHRFWM